MSTKSQENYPEYRKNKSLKKTSVEVIFFFFPTKYSLVCRESPMRFSHYLNELSLRLAC